MFSYEGFMRINAFLAAGYRILYLNVLWTATTILGLIVFGFGPASYAVASYIDGWFRRGDTPPVTRAFFAAVRADFWRSSVMGWLVLGAGAIIVTNIFSATVWAIQFVNVVALFALVVAGAYAFPVAAATDITAIHRRFGAALLIGFGSLHWTIIATAATAGAVWLLWHVALPLLVLFGIGIPATAIGLITRGVFRRLAAAPSEVPVPHLTSARGITE
ncbi:YesL family protein [Microbacterium sp. G2-8]|uniref:YesL family protein n=1 Tax=Microbacterium sp. G2-8 TaxID=2842454 RepID=UPI001C8AB57B|nr:DUF624 domain-containing protein [Microbacterium sp. G2-8]